MLRREWIDETVTVGTSVETLRPLLWDIDGWPTWTPGLQAIRRRDRGAPFTVGTRFTMVLKPGIYLPCQLFVQEPGRLEWGGGVPGSVVRHSFELTPTGAQTCQLRHLEYATGVLAALAWPAERSIYAYDHRWTKTIVARFTGGAAAGGRSTAA